MKVSLFNKKPNCRVYGLEFDLHGECECDAKVAESLIETGILVEIKPEKPAKVSKK